MKVLKGQEIICSAEEERNVRSANQAPLEDLVDRRAQDFRTRCSRLACGLLAYCTDIVSGNGLAEVAIVGVCNPPAIGCEGEVQTLRAFRAELQADILTAQPQ